MYNLDKERKSGILCLWCFQTKEQGKALLKAIAAKRIEQEDLDPEAEVNMSIVQEELFASSNTPL